MKKYNVSTAIIGSTEYFRIQPENAHIAEFKQMLQKVVAAKSVEHDDRVDKSVKDAVKFYSVQERMSLPLETYGDVDKSVKDIHGVIITIDMSKSDFSNLNFSKHLRQAQDISAHKGDDFVSFGDDNFIAVFPTSKKADRILKQYFGASIDYSAEHTSNGSMLAIMPISKEQLAKKLNKMN